MTSSFHQSTAGRLAIVAIFATLVPFSGLWSLPPLDRDESRFAQASTQMLETGDYINIRFQDRERNKKPAAIYWMQAASVSALSDVEDRAIWAYRIPSLIGIVLAAIFTFLAASKLYDPRTGLLAGFLLAAAPVVAAEATIAKTDGVLLAFICLAQLAFIHVYSAVREGKNLHAKWPLLFWTAHGLAILVKGPIGPLVSLLTGAGLMFGRPRFRWIWALRPITGVLILIAMIGPWAYAIWNATEGRFFTEAIGGDMIGKVNSIQESHAGPPGYHLTLLWLLFWPAAALLIAGLTHIWRDRAQWQARFLLSWIVPSWIVFEVAATKLPHYVMPLYPALAIVAAHAATKDGLQVTGARKIGAVLYGAIGLVAAGLVAALPIIFSAKPMTILCFAAAALIASASILIALLFWRGRAVEGGFSAAILSALYAWTVMTGVLPGLSTLAISPRISTALELQERHPLKNDLAPVALAGYAEPSAVFLLGTPTILTNGADAGRRLANGDVSAAVVEDRQRDAFLDVIMSAGVKIRPISDISGLNYSNGDDVRLIIYVRHDS